ncbi:MAG: hypothetical protein R2867_13990 [Caldilineaceae bacterium]
MARYLLAESVIAYAMETHGTERLLALLQVSVSIHGGKTWSHVHLACQLRNEAGWRIYVYERYGENEK